MADSFILKPSRDPLHACEERARRRVFVTGAGGKIGSYFAEHCHERYELRLLARTTTKAERIQRWGDVVVGDLARRERLRQWMAGCDTVLHLAARPSPRESWGPLLESNIIGTYNVFEAAFAAGCERVIFASSIHAVSGYGTDRQVQTNDPVSPGDLYGVSKCFGEALGRYMATQRGLSVLCVRIGAFLPVQEVRKGDGLAVMDAFVSQRDLNALLTCCVDDERLQFAILHGLSRNRFNRMNIAETRELVGYDPQDDFTEVDPDLKKLHLRQETKPHSERGQRT